MPSSSSAAGRHAAPGRSWSRRRSAPSGAPARAAVPAVLLGAGTAALVGLLPAGPAPVLTAAGAVAPRPLEVLAAPAPSPADVDRASRSRALGPLPEPPAPVPPPPPPPPPDPLPGCPDTAGGGYANGRLPASALCRLPGHDGHRLRPDAAHAFALLDDAFAARFGERLCVTDSYRSLAAQRSLARAKPRLAARPGTSEHGYGLAVDLACGVEGYRTAQHRWLAEHAPAYGWSQPSWARRGGSKPEPWHWEYRG